MFENRLRLKDITLICADTCYWGKSLDSLYWSIRQCNFGRVTLFTHQEFFDRGDRGEYGPNYREKLEKLGINITKVDYFLGKNGYQSYSHFLIKEVYKYINTKFFLITQADSWVINPAAWEDEFYNYDYIGSRWYFYNDDMNVGNGGFSLRSHKLHKILGEDDEFKGDQYAEDYGICRAYRRHLEIMSGIKYAPDAVADRFSYDYLPFRGNQFGFHCVDTKGYELSAAAKYGYFADWKPEIKYYNVPKNIRLIKMQ